VNKEQRVHSLRNQVTRLRKRIIRMRRMSYRYSWLRIAIVVVGLLGGIVALRSAGVWLLLVCLVGTGSLFVVIATLHRKTEMGILRHEVWLQIKSAHLARATLDWDHIPASFGFHARPDHPFETDLDIVGQRSVFRLLDTAVSLEASQRTRDWLTDSVPNWQTIRRRHTLVRELWARPVFRDKLAMYATVAGDQQRSWGTRELVEWLCSPIDSSSVRNWLLILGAMAALNASLFFANRVDLLPQWWQVTFVIYLGLVFARSSALAPIWEEAVDLHHSLRQLSAVFGHLETFGYSNAPHLRELAAPFLDAHVRPSAFLTRVNRVLAAIGIRGNPILWFLLNAVVPWDLFFAQRLIHFKTTLAERVPAWLDIWFELESLCSLANFGYLNPGYTFPVFVALDPFGHPPFRARGLGHPLLADSDKVCNDFEFSNLGEVSLITGSNMAGKSVFLKTVGVNCALANAGGPVNAEEFKTTTFRLFTSMRIGDSVTDGISFFYAEVKRLKALLADLERDHPLPLLYCIDEIFRGTNNRERLTGSRAYVRTLAGKNGVGLIATHDLELAKLADEMRFVKNYHFRDQVAEGRMIFDYRLRSGPCPTTNALAIMAFEGLPIE